LGLKILVVNSGSSTIKFRLYEAEGEVRELAKGLVERIGEESSMVDYSSHRGKVSYVTRVRDHEEGFQHMIRLLLDPGCGVISSIDEVVGIGHRVVHGGDKVTGSVIVDEGVEQLIEEVSWLAPLHNPANLLGIKAAKKFFPRALHVAVFDTAFFAALPEEAYLYAIPYEYYEKYRIRRYGFHGISHKYVAEEASKLLGKSLRELKLITCHLGNGASITAIDRGNPIDTSMGLTPLEGLVMGTRCGDIDPAVFYFLVKLEGLSVDEVYDILNRKSGVLGLSQISNDMRVLIERMFQGDERASRALKVYARRVKKYIGAYMALLNGVDAIVFTAGVGYNSAIMRKMILENMENMGIKLDDERNENPEKHGYIVSADDSKVKVLALPTNEELSIAREVLGKLKLIKSEARQD